MSNFYAQNGQFWLDGRPQLIQAGEFHYFRTPKEQWLHRMGLLKESGFNALASYIPWLWHQIREDVSDFDGHSHPMRDLAGFLDLAATMDFLIIARPGPYIMAETINEGVPPWVFNNYPQVAFISQDEKTQNIASYLHADFLACVRKWYRAVFSVLTPRQITNGGKIIMIQLDNEMGMVHWVRNILDVNPDTIARFAVWLVDTYGHEVAGRYPAADLPAFLRERIMNPTAPQAADVVADYRRFYREYLREYAAFLWTEARVNGMDVPPIVNVHGFSNDRGGRTFPIGLSQLINVIDLPGMITATDVYPIHIDEGNLHQILLVNEVTAAVQNKEQPLFSVEFQSGGNNDFGGRQSSTYDLHSRLSISLGMRAINHYLFFAGENDPILSPYRRHDWGPPVRKDGSVRRHYGRYGRLSQVLATYGEALTMARPQTNATIGFLLDYFMTEVNTDATSEATRIISHQRDWVLFDLIARGLALTHRPFDALELSRDDLDVSRMPVLWAMMDRQCPAGVQQKLVDYVASGGRLILAGRMCLEDFTGRPCTILQDVLGIRQVNADPPFVETTISALGDPEVPASFVESYTGRFDQEFAWRDGGEVVGFVNIVGEGQLMMLGATLTADAPEDLNLFHQMALRMGSLPLFKLSDWADVRLSCGENGSFLFINNYQDDPISTTVNYENKILFGGSAVRVPARSGLILPLDWRLNEDILVHFLTGEVVQIVADETGLSLKITPDEFTAELTIVGYRCDWAQVVEEAGSRSRVQIQGRDGQVFLRKEV
jgi:beta-galactosidase